MHVHKEGIMDTVEVHVEVREGVSHEDEALIQQFSKRIKNSIGLSMGVQLKRKGEIPMSEGGKTKRIIDFRK